VNHQLEPDEREQWAQECLAIANYWEFALGVVADPGYREWLRKLVVEWKRAATEGSKEQKTS
jgi:hypothetical protein